MEIACIDEIYYQKTNNITWEHKYTFLKGVFMAKKNAINQASKENRDHQGL